MERLDMFIVTGHDCGGSMAEACEPAVVLGPFDTYLDANAAADEFYELIAAVDESFHQDWLPVVIEVPPTFVGAKDAAEVATEGW